VLVSSAGKSTVQALCGVVFASLASGFGETTYLGLTTYYAPVTLSAWTCGTGTSALLASFSYALLSDLLSPRIATFCFTFVPTVTLFAFCCLLPHQPHTDLSSPTDSTLQPLLGTEPTATAYQTSGTFDSSAHRAARSVRVSDDCESQDVNEDDLIAEQHGTLASTPVALFQQTGEQVTLQRRLSTSTVDGSAKSSWTHSVPTWNERWRIVGNLRWFLVVLFWVYYLEYLTNQGLAELIIFRNTTVRPAAQYRWYQFCFRFGAFIARCSILVVHIRFVYAFPPLQLLNFLLLLAQIFVPYLPTIDFVFAIMLWEGLVGGATYGNVLKRIADECEPHFREYSLSIVTLADAAGIALAGFTAMPIHDAICTYFHTAA
jgi:battenin